MTDSTVAPDDWKSVMGYFASGVTVVTAWDGAEPVGSTVSAFCSVSLEPPLLMICLDEKNPVLRPIKDSGVFGVNILAADSEDIAMRFSTPMETNRFDGHEYANVNGGAPRLDAAPAFIDCVVHQSHLAGDHELIIGRGLRMEKRLDAIPMVYHQGRFLDFSS